jgi:hypothetical protein
MLPFRLTTRRGSVPSMNAWVTSFVLSLPLLGTLQNGDDETSAEVTLLRRRMRSLTETDPDLASAAFAAALKNKVGEAQIGRDALAGGASRDREARGSWSSAGSASPPTRTLSSLGEKVSGAGGVSLARLSFAPQSNDACGTRPSRISAQVRRRLIDRRLFYNAD